MLTIDTTTEFGARAERRLREDRLGWLTTVRADGMPQPVPVWFLVQDDGILLYSRPGQQKLRNIAANPNVSLNLDGNGQGGDIVVLSCTAAIVTDVPPANQVPAYVARYTEGFKRIGMTAEEFATTYSAAIRLTPAKLFGH